MKVTSPSGYIRNNIQKQPPVKKTSRNESFKGGISDGIFNAIDKAFSVLDKNAMIQVSFVDTVSTNIPRTLVDLKTGLAAAFETCRREFSGLFVNCLMPGLLVKALALVLPKSKELKGTNPAQSWSNGAVIDRLKEIYTKLPEQSSEGKTKEFVKKSLEAIEGLDGTSWIKYADKAETPEFKEAAENIVQAVGKTGRERKTLLKSAKAKLANITKAENILKFNGKPQANLEETLRDITDMGARFSNAEKNNVPIENYAKSLTKFVNKKSLIGMALVIGIAVSVQTINRAITRKQFKAEGAPIYKDFGKKDTTQKMDEKQKKKFFAKKLASAAGMYGLAALSMMKKPSLGMFQFSNIFPTLDQCRWIAASTFASRMLGAEDENELRETTVRDIASFSGLYFLGDYVKKGVASAIEALSKTRAGKNLTGENVVLLNRSKVIEKPLTSSLGEMVKYRAKQFGNWIKNTELKTAQEVAGTKVRNLRNICRIADIAFSIVMLGILLPKYNRSVTEKKVEAAKKQQELEERSGIDYVISQNKNIPQIFKEIV